MATRALTNIFTLTATVKTIYQAGSEDIVNLLNVSLEQIAGAEIKENEVPAQFTDGGSLNIERQVYHADYQNKTWS